MNVLINHCWCSDSIWGGIYDCRVIVTVEQFATRDDVYDRKAAPDWITLFDKVEAEVEILGRKVMDDVHRLKPEVVKWLDENIKDKNCKRGNRTELSLKKGWGVGTDQYNSNSGIDFSLFFERPKDAMKFIKQWSAHKNPVNYLNYFKDIRRQLNVKTGRLSRVPRWTNEN